MQSKIYHILLIGAGQLGSRHLQALGLSKLNLKISVVEPSSTAIEIASERYRQITHLNNVSFYNDLTAIASPVDLCIIATNASARLVVLKSLLSRVSVRYLIFEKVLFQNQEQLHEADLLLQQHKVSAWVNCPRRMNSLYQQLKAKLFGEHSISLTVTGNNWGLACNAIHFIDLWAYLADINQYDLDTMNLLPTIYPAKRIGYKEIAGSLVGKNSSHYFELSCQMNDEPVNALITIESERYMIHINEAAGVCKLYSKQFDIVEELTFKILPQSHLTQEITETIIMQGLCALTSYKESMSLHKPFLNKLLIFFNEYDEVSHTTCPIT